MIKAKATGFQKTINGAYQRKFVVVINRDLTNFGLIPLYFVLNARKEREKCIENLCESIGPYFVWLEKYLQWLVYVYP